MLWGWGVGPSRRVGVVGTQTLVIIYHISEMITATVVGFVARGKGNTYVGNSQLRCEGGCGSGRLSVASSLSGDERIFALRAAVRGRGPGPDAFGHHLRSRARAVLGKENPGRLSDIG